MFPSLVLMSFPHPTPILSYFYCFCIPSYKEGRHINWLNSYVKVKVIFENCYLSDEQKVLACRLCGEAGADYIKTSTGYGTSGATAEDLKIMKANAGHGMKVKAAGGVRTLHDVLVVRKLGGARIGATASKPILEEAQRRAEKGELAELPDDAELVLGTGSY